MLRPREIPSQTALSRLLMISGVKNLKSRIRKPVFFVVFFLIAAFTVLSTMGISTRYGDTITSYVWGLDDIRWGIDKLKVYGIDKSARVAWSAAYARSANVASR